MYPCTIVHRSANGNETQSAEAPAKTEAARTTAPPPPPPHGDWAKVGARRNPERCTDNRWFTCLPRNGSFRALPGSAVRDSPTEADRVVVSEVAPRPCGDPTASVGMAWGML